MKKPEGLGGNIFLIDDYDLGRVERTGTYVIMDEAITLVETCASPSLPYILDGLQQLEIALDDISYIIVTHVHLDHGGAAGLLMKKCKNAKLIVHPRGARHMIDPSKLIKGAQAVYGTKFDNLFAPILPVPEKQVQIVQDGETLSIGARQLTFYDTPGHAKHHISIHDSLTNGMFTGDTIGVYYKELEDTGVEFYLPSTSPSQFDPDAMLQSMERIKQLEVEQIYFGHYGRSFHTAEVYTQLKQWLPYFVETGKMIFAEEKEFTAAVASLTNALYDHIRSYLAEKGVSPTHTVYEILKLDMEVSSMGIIDYLTKQEEALIK
ncbi:MBL fold metallo-hydrolase [Microbacteriaceae bacterium 4G12]